MDFSYLKETLDQANKYKDLGLFLTGIIESQLRNSSMDPYDRYQLLNNLITAHEKYPCLSSDEWVASWKQEFKDLLLPAMTAEEIDALPY